MNDVFMQMAEDASSIETSSEEHSSRMVLD
jgi:hypothetical protein